MKPNRLGWITEINVTPSMGINEITSDYMPYVKYTSGIAQVDVDLHFVASNPGALMMQFNKWIEGDVKEPTYQEEFMCLYCGSPNSIEHTHCKKCGAPRSFIIG